MKVKINELGQFVPKYAPIIIGERFGFWTVLSKGSFKHNQQRWLCRCDCGQQREVAQQHLRGGKSTKCLKCVGRIHHEKAHERNLSNNSKLPYNSDGRKLWVMEIRKRLFESQNGICPICDQPLSRGRSERKVIDHDHLTGYCRALVHDGCNIFIGLIETRPERIDIIKDYLKKYSEIHARE